MLLIQQIVLLGIKNMKLWMWHWTDMLDGHVGRTQKVAPNTAEWPIWHHGTVSSLVDSLVPGKFEWNFRHVIFKQILVIDDWGISCEITLTWKPQDLTDDKSTLIQVMAWCRQATSHYLSQCWPSSLSPYGVTRPLWVKVMACQLVGDKPLSEPTYKLCVIYAREDNNSNV